MAVQGETGAQPEGAFLNFVNWIGNVIAPVEVTGAVVGAMFQDIYHHGAIMPICRSRTRFVAKAGLPYQSRGAMGDTSRTSLAATVLIA